MRARRPLASLVVGAALFLAGLVTGGGAVWFYDRQVEHSPLAGLIQREKRQGGFTLINPLLECDAPVEMTELSRFEDRVEALIESKVASGKAASVSVYFRDLNNGPWFGINEKEPFLPASLLKLPVLMAYLKLAEDDPSVLRQSYVANAASLNVPLHEFPHVRKLVEGRSYTVEELLRQMIVNSDNQAVTILNRDPEKHFARVFRDLNIPLPGSAKPEDFMDVKTYATFFRILYNASYLSDEMSEFALTLLTQTEFVHGLPGGVPAGLPVAHKYGEWVVTRPEPQRPLVQFHDCGIVYYPTRPYLLCVMSRGDDVAELLTTIQDISKTVYEAVDEQHPR